MRVPSRRALALMAGALGACAFAAVAFAGGDRGPGDQLPAATARSTSTTERTERARERTPTTADEPAEAAEPSTTTSSPVDFVAEPIGERRAIVVTPDDTVSIDLSENTIRRVAHGDDVATQYGAPLVGAGHSAFLLSAQQLYVVPLSLEQPLRRVGSALMLLRSSTAGRVWVAREGRGGYVLEELDSTGATVRTTPPLPVDASPHAVLGDRVVLDSPEGNVLVWNATTARVEWTSPPASRVVAAAGERVVWQRTCSSPLCVLHVTDVRTGRDQTIPNATDAGDYYGGEATISPSGRYLASFRGSPGGGPTPFRIRLVDLSSGLVAEADSVEPGRILWSPDDKWLFLSGDGDPNRPLRWAYRVEDLDIRRVDLRVPSDFEALAVAIL